MKVFVVISLCLACVAARGSGPYLPSGWKPDGPAFYLPSEVAKPVENPVTEVILQESEASGSDFLREYGPPKGFSPQALPDVDNENVFVEAVVEANGVGEITDVLAAVSEEKSEVNSEVKSSVEEVTQSQIAAELVSVSNNEEEIPQANFESTTATNVVESDQGNEETYVEESTAAGVEIYQKATNEVNEELVSQIVEESVASVQQVSGIQQEGIDVIDAPQFASGAQQGSTSIVNEQQSEVQLDLVSAVEERIQTVEEDVKKVEEIVQNIPEMILSLENEVKAEQVQTIPEVPIVVEETLGSLEQAPESFLKYGPPGFREYGPPKGDLRESAIEEKILDLGAQLVNSNEVRRRRFSPKFRPSKKIH